jgi:hypothetical protein
MAIDNKKRNKGDKKNKKDIYLTLNIKLIVYIRYKSISIIGYSKYRLLLIS